MSQRQDPPLRKALAAIILIATARLAYPAANDESVSIDDVRFASQIGAPTTFSVSKAASLTRPLQPVFRGGAGRSCWNLDLNTFLHQFDPRELLTELRQSLLSGAQSEISNYFVALAYSAPTLVSVLDITDRQIATRFLALAQSCSTQQMRAVSLEEPGRTLTRASDQCFARETSRGTPPTDAYRRCTVAMSFDALALPATLSTLEFLRRHSDLVVTPQIESLLALLPDQQIIGGNYQVRPPAISLSSVSGALQVRSRQALDQMLDGATSSPAAECTVYSILDSSGPACLPRSASAIVSSSAFLGARLLGPAARSIFKEGMSSQIAVTAVYSELLDLAQQIARMNLRSDSDASASEIISRQRLLQEQVMRLLSQADLQVKLQESKLKLIRTQLLALERAQTDLQVAADALQSQQKTSSFGFASVVQLFQDHN